MESLSAHPYLRSKFQIGSAKSDKVNFAQTQVVFHSGDIRSDVRRAKQEVVKSKSSNILGTAPRAWNQSTAAEFSFKDDPRKDLRRQLLKARSGAMDERTLKPSKLHSDERVSELQRYVVGITGQGPVGKLTGKWMNPVEERGLSNHCIADHWPDWNQSHSANTPEDIQQAKLAFAKKEARREQMSLGHPKVDHDAYVNPEQAVGNLNDRIRERKVDFQPLKDQFKRELKAEYPDASEERLQAMSQRLLNEKLLADAKLARFPIKHETHMPNLSMTLQDRRYKEYYHPGTYSFNEAEKRECWSCCMNFSESNKGCEYRVKNPDAWCTLGFERSPGMASTARRGPRS